MLVVNSTMRKPCARNCSSIISNQDAGRVDHPAAPNIQQFAKSYSNVPRDCLPNCRIAQSIVKSTTMCFLMFQGMATNRRMILQMVKGIATTTVPMFVMSQELARNRWVIVQMVQGIATTTASMFVMFQVLATNALMMSPTVQSIASKSALMFGMLQALAPRAGPPCGTLPSNRR